MRATPTISRSPTSVAASCLANYEVLMKTLRNKLDSAGTEDGRKYMLTIASPALGLPAARHGKLPGHPVPRLRQPDDL